MKKILYGILIIFLSRSTLISSPSSLDTSFNNNGSTTNLFVASALNQAQDIKVQADGKIVTVGFAGDNGIIIRYDNDGNLDRTFNASGPYPGCITLRVGTQSSLFGVVIQPNNGKIITAGYAIINNVEEAFIARYNKNGTPDVTFGPNGTGYITSRFQSQSRLFGIDLQSNSYIVVTGWSFDNNGLSNALVARYTQTGALDTTFNNSGYIKTLIGTTFTRAQSVKVQKDGKIVITGQAQVDNNQGLVVIRYTSSGLLDTDFNSTGYTFPFSDFAASHGAKIALHDDQKIVVVGSANPTDQGFSNQYYTIVQLNTNGTLDSSFNGIGYVIDSIGYFAHGVVIQTNGQIVTCGFTYKRNYEIIVARYNLNGSLDQTFDYSTNSIQSNMIANAVTLQHDGKILVAGTITVPFA